MKWCMKDAPQPTHLGGVVQDAADARGFEGFDLRPDRVLVLTRAEMRKERTLHDSVDQRRTDQPLCGAEQPLGVGHERLEGEEKEEGWETGMKWRKVRGRGSPRHLNAARLQHQ